MLLAALFQISCHSSWQNFETRGISSQAGSFMLVTVRSRAALAAVSALSLPGKYTSDITHHTIDVELVQQCIHGLKKGKAAGMDGISAEHVNKCLRL